MYDPKDDPTVGGVIAEVIVNLIGAYMATCRDGAPIEVLRTIQGQAAKAINDYLVHEH